MITLIWMIGVFLSFIVMTVIAIIDNNEKNRLFKIPVYRVNIFGVLAYSLLWPVILLYVVIALVIEMRGK